MTSWIFAGGLALLSLLGALAYRSLWRALRPDGATPTGYGGVLALVLLGAGLWQGAPRDIALCYAVIAATTALYWIDDAFELNARLRFFVQFASGLALAAIVLGVADPLNLGLCVLGGLTNVVLTNVINFCDGADLNLAVLPVLTAAIVLFAGPPDVFAGAAVATLAFVLPFAAVNARPKTLYFGDSGCFAFACLLTLMAAYYVRERSTAQIYAAVPMALPLFDAFYVFVTRVRNKEDLLSRNYLHLYQKLQARFGGFHYLWPQVLNVAVVIALALALRAAGFAALYAVPLAMALATPAFYLIYRRLSLREA